MPERIQLTGPPEQAAAQLWAHIQEKTMLEGEKLPKFNSLEATAQHYLPLLSRDELEKVNDDLIKTLQKMKDEREDIFEKNSALEDAVGKLIKENIYLQRQLAAAVNAMTDQQKRMAVRLQEINEQQSRAKVACQMDQERQNMEQILEASLQ